MNELIPIQQTGVTKLFSQSVNARDLHKSLNVGRRFATWIVERIKEYGFIENQDFVAISQKREIGHGRGKIDYHLTLDMAKELAMVEKTEVGREVRRYFIECERKLQEAMAERLALAEPKAAALDLLSDRKEAINFRAAAKSLTEREKEVRAVMVQWGWIFKQGRIEATHKALDGGYMLQTAGISSINGRAYTQSLITGKGLAKLAEHFSQKETA
ncbi:antA/AntB antirepressor family protein [Neisseria shayeganii]|uniref:AntA/AntB antirepressor family protein n=1 Tax=Neisseria shayeganii TaxID=607712 RepID=A0A7D7N4M8_9NEIS|nr:antA/AntB antirepressor family protein [Neisseria shayeganii]QMT41385.1 antA/AntB antirepressor family protein [Neisseria shayeganii]